MSPVALFIFMIVCHIQGKILRLPCGKFHAPFSRTFHKQRLHSSSAVSIKTKIYTECIGSCIRFQRCQSINIDINDGICELLESTLEDDNASLRNENNWLHVETEYDPVNLGPLCAKQKPCKNGAHCVDICDLPGYQCACSESLQRVRTSDCAYDIAMNKATEQSSDFMGTDYLETSNHAVDGLKDTLSRTKTLVGQFWRIDFGRIMQFDEITVVLARYYVNRKFMEEAQVLVSRDKDFRSATLCHEFPKTLLPKTYMFRCTKSPATARYMKIVLARMGSLVLFDILVYGWEI